MSSIVKASVDQPLNTPLLFLVFNRPDTTREVFESIRRVKPLHLYIAADGPRLNRQGESELVSEVREIVNAVDWPCKVNTLFRRENLGCKLAVSEAISWFFENEEFGIILEDDCLPSPDFFPYCEELLHRYRDNDQVFAVTGNNFQDGIRRGESAYYFSRYFHCWGWASWRRAWKTYDVNMSYWPDWLNSEDWKCKVPDRVERNFWQTIFNNTFSGKINTWDYQWSARIWQAGGVVATPNVNLVTNIGFGADATHTLSENSKLAEMPTESLGSLTHPLKVQRNLASERYVFDYYLGGADMRFPRREKVFFLRQLKKIWRIFFQNK